MKPHITIRKIHRKLATDWGPQHWWPAETPLEVIVGAILTQNTSWTNVERAIAALRDANALSMEALRTIPLTKLEQLIRSSGYFRQKAERLKGFIAFVDRKFAGSLDAMLSRPTAELRAELLALKGIGPETADSILLYAGQHCVFVVDAYTQRVLQRHEAISAGAKYEEVRELVEAALKEEEGIVGQTRQGAPTVHPSSAMSSAERTQQAQVYNEMHGLFVQLGKHYCTKREPNCDVCPLLPELGPPFLPERAKPNKTPSGRQAKAAKKRGTAKV